MKDWMWKALPYVLGVLGLVLGWTVSSSQHELRISGLEEKVAIVQEMRDPLVRIETSLTFIQGDVDEIKRRLDNRERGDAGSAPTGNYYARLLTLRHANRTTQ